MVSNRDSVDLACQRFTDLFVQFANECIPSKVVLIRPNDKPWINSNIRTYIRIRDRLHKKSKFPNTFQLSGKNQRNKVDNMPVYFFLRNRSWSYRRTF